MRPLSTETPEMTPKSSDRLVIAAMDIPEDIREKAIDACCCHDCLGQIASAILAERERCAKIAEDKRWGGDALGASESLCDDIAEAIRKPTDNSP